MFRNNWIRILGVFCLFIFIVLGNISGCSNNDSGGGEGLGGGPGPDDGPGLGGGGLLPGSSLSPIKGISYQPVPSDYPTGNSCSQIYFDTDFFNTDFACLWQTDTGSRGDLATIAGLGANFLHLYDWNPQRDHTSFLDECETENIRVAVPINNYFANNPVGTAQSIVDIINEVYGGGTTPNSAVVMWTIANEYDLPGNNVSAAQIAQVAQILLYAEQNIVDATVTLPISSPVSFGASGDSNGTPAVNAIHNLYVAFSNTQSFTATINNNSVTIPALPSDFWETRYVAATNPQNCGSTPDCSSGLTIATFLSTSGTMNSQSFQNYFCSSSSMNCDDCVNSSTGNCFPMTNLWFSEIGPGVLLSCSGWMAPCTTSEQQQADFLGNALDASIPGTPSFFLGNSVFEYMNETWKGNPATTNDSTFGITKYSGTELGTCMTTASAPMCPSTEYPVDNLDDKPSFSTVESFYN